MSPRLGVHFDDRHVCPERKGRVELAEFLLVRQDVCLVRQRHTRAGYQSRQFGPCHGAVGDTGDADQSPFEDDDVVRACLADRCQSPLGLVEQPSEAVNTADPPTWSDRDPPVPPPMGICTVSP